MSELKKSARKNSTYIALIQYEVGENYSLVKSHGGAVNGFIKTRHRIKNDKDAVHHFERDSVQTG